MSLGYPRDTLGIQSRILHLMRRKKDLKKILSLDEYGRARN